MKKKGLSTRTLSRALLCGIDFGATFILRGSMYRFISFTYADGKQLVMAQSLSRKNCPYVVLDAGLYDSDTCYFV